MTDSTTGRIVAHFGQRWAVEDENRRIVLCQTGRHVRHACVGDRVSWRGTNPHQGQITEILPRKTLLTRPGRHGKPRPVAANIDQVLVVIAPEPRYDLLLVDQYLVVCENLDLAPVIVLNKTDLITENQRRDILQDLAPYQLHCPTPFVCAKTGEGLGFLGQTLAGKVSLLAGQSGVGKSSLLKTLIPDKSIRIGTLSTTSRRGRHTTTFTTLLHLSNGGDIIDTPGVAIFGLAGLNARQLAYGYREFRPYITQCRFNDCCHVADRGCAVRKAVEEGKIYPPRYRRYLKLLEKLPKIS